MVLLWIATTIASVALCCGALLAAGWLYQQSGERADRGKHPPPGRMIDIGGRRLHMVSAGEGNPPPAVVIEAGSGDDSASWRAVLSAVAAFAPAFAYDRAGLGWSDPTNGPRSFADRAADLHTAIVGADIPRPYVLVGHSYGGYIVRLLARAHPENVAGLVLVDASEEGFAFDPAGLASAATVGARAWRRGWLARFGVLRLVAALFPDRFPSSAEALALQLRSAHYFETADEMAAYQTTPSSMARPGGFGLLGALPLAVVSRSARDPMTGNPASTEWLAAQARLAELSRNSRRLVAEKSGHNIQASEPDIIVNAIRWVREQAGGNRPA